MISVKYFDLLKDLCLINFNNFFFPFRFRIWVTFLHFHTTFEEKKLFHTALYGEIFSLAVNALLQYSELLKEEKK